MNDLSIAALFLLVSFVTRLPVFMRSVMDWDESLYFLMAQQWRAGHLPYTMLWDNKPLGIYAIFSLFQSIFGDTLFGMRIAAVIFTAATAFLVFKLVQIVGAGAGRAAGKAGLVAGLAYLVCTLSDDGLAANTEIFMVAFTAAAAWCALSRLFCARQPALKGFCVGLLLGAAFMIKFVIALEVPAVMFGLLFVSGTVPRAAFWRAALGVTVGGLLPVLFTVLLYLHAGDMRIWVDANLLANFRRGGVGFPPFGVPLMLRFLKWLPLYLVALPVLFETLRKPRLDVSAFITLWLLGGMLGVISAKSFYPHYFQQILPALCVSLGWALLRWPALRGGRALAAIFLIPILSAVITLGIALRPVTSLRGGFEFTADTPQQIANDLAADAPGSTLYVFDYEPVLYTLTGAALPTRYVYPAFITTCFLAHVAAVQPQAELRRILIHAPQFIVIGHKPVTELPVDPAVYADMRKALAVRYEVWGRYPEATLYRLRPGPLPPLPPPSPDGCKG